MAALIPVRRHEDEVHEAEEIVKAQGQVREAYGYG